MLRAFRMQRFNGGLLVLITAATTLTLLRPDTAHSSAEPPAQESASTASSSGAKRPLATVTIEAKKERELKRQISHFIANVVVTYLNDSLQRWNTPVCPLVAGLPSERGEFILARVSQIVTASHAPLAPEHCKPNFYVVVTQDPDLLVEKWWSRDRELLHTHNGMGPVRDFMHARQPVRVWYNASFRSRDDVALSADSIGVDIANLRLSPGAVSNNHASDSRLVYSEVQALSSVIIVVDSRRTTHLNIGQLADYVAMVGLAQVRLDADTGTAPTILHLFRETEQPVQSLSVWDQSFLYSLYTTDQTSVVQISRIRRTMLDRLEH
jgi:hypothetical protein